MNIMNIITILNIMNIINIMNITNIMNIINNIDIMNIISIMNIMNIMNVMKIMNSLFQSFHSVTASSVLLLGWEPSVSGHLHTQRPPWIPRPRDSRLRRSEARRRGGPDTQTRKLGLPLTLAWGHCWCWRWRWCSFDPIAPRPAVLSRSRPGPEQLQLASYGP